MCSHNMVHPNVSVRECDVSSHIEQISAVIFSCFCSFCCESVWKCPLWAEVTLHTSGAIYLTSDRL